MATKDDVQVFTPEPYFPQHYPAAIKYVGASIHAINTNTNKNKFNISFCRTVGQYIVIFVAVHYLQWMWAALMILYALHHVCTLFIIYLWNSI